MPVHHRSTIDEKNNIKVIRNTTNHGWLSVGDFFLKFSFVKSRNMENTEDVTQSITEKAH